MLLRKLMRNSPFPYQLVFSKCDFRLLAVGKFLQLILDSVESVEFLKKFKKIFC